MSITVRDQMSKKGILCLVLAFCLAVFPSGVMADDTAGEDVVEAATEAVEAGVPAAFVDAAIEKARTAGLDDDDIEEMLEDLTDAYEDGTGKDLDAIVDDHIAGMDDDDMDDMDDDDMDDMDDDDMDDDDMDDMDDDDMDDDDDDDDSDDDSDDDDDEGDND